MSVRRERRRFSADYKRSILDTLDAAPRRGAGSALLKAEGLHWSHVAAWRRQACGGRLADSWTSPDVRGELERLARERREILREIRTLERANAALRRALVAPALPGEDAAGPRRAAAREPGRPE